MCVCVCVCVCVCGGEGALIASKTGLFQTNPLYAMLFVPKWFFAENYVNCVVIECIQSPVR